MTEQYDKVLISKIRDLTPNLLAEELCSVQPIPSDALRPLLENAKSREDLIAEGYRPVSRIGLMWAKDEPVSSNG